MSTTFLNAVITAIIGLGAGVGEAFLLISAVDAITSNKGIPIFRMLCFVGAPLCMLALVIYFFDPMCCIISGVGASISLIATAFIIYFVKKKIRR